MLVKWLNDVFAQTPSLHDGGIIAIKTGVIYFFLVGGLRLFGKRQLGQMNIYDLVLIIVLANAVQNAMVGSDNSLVGGLIAATTLLVLNRILTTAMSHSPALEQRLIGNPSLIVNDGKLVLDHMRREGITREQVMAALREHGLCSLDEVHLAILEVDGTISVVPKDATVLKTRRHFKALRL